MRSCWKYLKLAVFLILIPQSGQATAYNSGVTYTGRIYKSDGTPVATTVSFTVGIYSITGCELYLETRTLDMSASAGNFSFDIGDGNAASSAFQGTLASMTDVFDNTKTFTGLLCTGNSYQATLATEPRLLTISFNAGDGAQNLPTLKVNPVPAALQAYALGGHDVNHVLRVDPTIVSPTNPDLTAANLTEFWKLLNGTSANYLTASTNFSSDVTGTSTTLKVVKLQGVTLDPTAPTVNQYLKYDGTKWTPSALAATGTMTSITAGTGLTGGTITTSGTIAANVGTGPNQLVQLDGSSKLPAVDGSALTGVAASALGGVNVTLSGMSSGQVLTYNGSNWINATNNTAVLNNGLIWVGNAANFPAPVTMSGDASIISSGAVTVNKTSAGLANTILALDGSGVAQVYGVGVKGSSSGEVNLRSTASSGTYSLTFPAAAPAAGQALQSDASGNLSWVTGFTSTGTTGAFINGGNSFGTTTSLGTNDNNALSFVTNGGTRMILNTSGELGIGVASPSATLDVNGDINIPQTTSTTGQLLMNDVLYLHSAGDVSNLFLGSAAGNTTETGIGNTGLGYKALNSITTGDWDVAIGGQALQNNTGGTYNTAVGLQAMLANIGGSLNTSVGFQTMLHNTTGEENTALGYAALAANVGGSYNVGVGNTALVGNVSGNGNVAIGELSLQSTNANDNIGIGDDALTSNTSGIDNIAIGRLAGTTSTAANGNTTGNNNIYIGNNSGPGTSTQLSNSIAIGANAVVSASNSLVLGAPGMSVGIGTSTPNAALQVAGGTIGMDAGQAIKWGTSTYSFIYGTDGGPGSSSLGIGVGATAIFLDSSDHVGIHNTNPLYPLDVIGDVNIASGNLLRFGGVQVCATAGCTATSDRRLKENIAPLNSSLENILKLEAVSYDWKDKEKFGKGPQIGLIAQDLEKVYPQVVVTDTHTGLKSVAYDHLVAPLIESVKALHAKILALTKSSDQHSREIASIRQENLQLKKQVDDLKEKTEKSRQENSLLKAYLCEKDPQAAFCK